MLRIPAVNKIYRPAWARLHSSSSIRTTFINYFVENHQHKFVKSSSVVPLSDPTVPFVNAGMNQFKGVFLGTVAPPHPRVVNSQKCIRVGGKHNDLEIVGTDGHHHTFFEMLGNWSFGDYYKEEACKMAWELLTGPYQLKPERLLVTYFAGDPVIGLIEDRECRDAWRKLGVPADKIIAQNASENFWEMGATGPCGPCTEIHYINDDLSHTELWNIVFIHCKREEGGKVVGLRNKHVDTGMGLERMTALLQGVPSNYDTDLFVPIIRAIEKNCKSVDGYKGRYGSDAGLDAEYRRLADHARMISVCLADGAFPSSNLNLKQIMRTSFKISNDVFKNPLLMLELYNVVAESLGSAYPELVSKEVQAKRVIEYEMDSYKKLRSDLKRKWSDLVTQHPEVESLKDVEYAGFALGYKEFKKAIANITNKIVPGEVVFKLYDTYGFKETLIDKIASLNKMEIDRTGFWKLLTQHKARHKTALKEYYTDKSKYNEAIKLLQEKGVHLTNDLAKYQYKIENDNIVFPPLQTELVGILNEHLEWVDFLDPVESFPYRLVTMNTNFYCENGGQEFDTGTIVLEDNIVFNVVGVHEICGYVFHEGYFLLDKKNNTNYVNNASSSAVLTINSDRRLEIMKNHTATHLLNAAIRQVLPHSGIYQVGSKVTEKGLQLSLAVYGEKLTRDLIMDVQNMVRKAIEANVKVRTRVVTQHDVREESVTTVPGELYPEDNIRLVMTDGDVNSMELCCGTHVPSTKFVEEFCITHVKGANSNSPTIYAIAGKLAKEAREQFCHAQKLEQLSDLLDPKRKEEEVLGLKNKLASLCVGSGAPAANYAECLTLLDHIMSKPQSTNMELQSIAEQEIHTATASATDEGRRYLVHFLRCSYLMQHFTLEQVLKSACDVPLPTILIGCAGGTILGVCRVPSSMTNDAFTAERWLSTVVPVFRATLATAPGRDKHHFAQMIATKVSLITCEQQVQDAMRAAEEFAQMHISDEAQRKTSKMDDSKDENIQWEPDTPMKSKI